MTNLMKRLNTYVQKPWRLGLQGFNAKIAKIPNLIYLTLGEPSFGTPDHIKRAAIKAIENNDSHYTDPRGLMSLRVNASRFFKNKYGLDFDPKTQMLVTTGASEGISSVLSTILNKGDEVLMPSPIYPFYIPNVFMHGAKLVYINTAKSQFRLTPQELKSALKRHPHAKAIILTDPNNPTGVVYTKSELEALAKVLKQYPIFCISDEIYSELTYGFRHYSIAKFIPRQTIVMNGVSKAFAMTGWRIGLVCGPSQLISKINKVHAFTIMSATTCAQYAASEAYKNGADDDAGMKKDYRKKSRILANGLNQLGFQCIKPQGSFYVFAKLPKKYQNDSFGFAIDLAKRDHVGLVPGSVFGPGGEGYVRVSYATRMLNIMKALKRIKSFLNQNR